MIFQITLQSCQLMKRSTASPILLERSNSVPFLSYSTIKLQYLAARGSNIELAKQKRIRYWFFISGTFDFKFLLFTTATFQFTDYDRRLPDIHPVMEFVMGIWSIFLLVQALRAGEEVCWAGMHSSDLVQHAACNGR